MALNGLLVKYLSPRSLDHYSMSVEESDLLTFRELSPCNMYELIFLSPESTYGKENKLMELMHKNNDNNKECHSPSDNHLLHKVSF